MRNPCRSALRPKVCIEESFSPPVQTYYTTATGSREPCLHPGTDRTQSRTALLLVCLILVCCLYFTRSACCAHLYSSPTIGLFYLGILRSTQPPGEPCVVVPAPWRAVRRRAATLHGGGGGAVHAVGGVNRKVQAGERNALRNDWAGLFKLGDVASLLLRNDSGPHVQPWRKTKSEQE